MINRGRGWQQIGEWGETLFAENDAAARGRVPGIQRMCKIPDDDPWYDVPSGSPVLSEISTDGWRKRR